MVNSIQDVVVVGSGAIGSASCYYLAKSGLKVLGIDQFQPPHNVGSSHGSRRMIRQAYFEDPRYIPLLKQVYPLWESLCKEYGQNYFHKVGLLTICDQSSSVMECVLNNSDNFEVALRILRRKELVENYPMFEVDQGSTATFEPGAGYLEVEKCIEMIIALAKKSGVNFQFEKKVIEWKEDAGKVLVSLDNGETILTSKLLFCCGAWSPKTLKLDLGLSVARVSQFWFPENKSWAEKAEQNNLPCFAFSKGEEFIYGFPKDKYGYKIADYAPNSYINDPFELNHNSSFCESRALSSIKNRVIKNMPWINCMPIKVENCLYTMSPDKHFIVDAHPNYENVFFFAGGSGHAFKFAPVIGKYLAQLVGDESDANLQELFSFLRIKRN